jgi:hypothetical protein
MIPGYSDATNIPTGRYFTLVVCHAVTGLPPARACKRMTDHWQTLGNVTTSRTERVPSVCVGYPQLRNRPRRELWKRISQIATRPRNSFPHISPHVRASEAPQAPLSLSSGLDPSYLGIGGHTESSLASQHESGWDAEFSKMAVVHGTWREHCCLLGRGDCQPIFVSSSYFDSCQPLIRVVGSLT